MQNHSFYRQANGVPKDRPSTVITPLPDIINTDQMDINLSEDSEEENVPQTS